MCVYSLVSHTIMPLTERGSADERTFGGRAGYARLPFTGGPALFCSRFIPVRRAAVGGLRFGGEFLADCSPGSGRGRRAGGARECAVLAGDVSGTHVGRGARRPRVPGCSGEVLECRADRRAVSPELRGCRRAGRRAGR